MRSFRPMIMLAAAFWLLAAPASRGQTREQDPRQPNQPGQIDAIRVETSLVTVPAIVTDRAGRFATGLSRGDFQLFEDGKPQEITSFSSTETPFNVVLLIDTSRSTRELLGEIRKAARSFVNQLQPQDRVLIVAFDERVNFLGDFTSDRRELRRTINSVKSSYLTTVYDAISRTINEKLAPLKGRKAIVIFSDGVDTWSRQATYESTLDLAARSGALIYAVQYSTNDQRDGGYRSITVRLKRDDLVVRARKRYRAPKAENRDGANQETKPLDTSGKGNK